MNAQILSENDGKPLVSEMSEEQFREWVYSTLRVGERFNYRVILELCLIAEYRVALRAHVFTEYNGDYYERIVAMVNQASAKIEEYRQ